MSPCDMIRRLAPTVAVLVLVSAGPLLAQSPSGTFGGLSESSSEPIDIESDTLTVYDAQKYATFKGNVKAVQGTTTLRAAELVVHYVGGADKLTGKGAEPAQPAAPAPPATQAAAPAAADSKSPEAQINKIEARGDVVIVSKDDQTTTSDWALYDVPAQLVTVGGNVVLSQGQNVLKGDRLVIDLKTGESRFENTGNTAAGGRIRALFMPKGAPAQPADAEKPSGDDQPAATAPADGEAGPGNEAAVDSAEPWEITPQSR
jgi:lipopolysaccharide export system protein LptA